MENKKQIEQPENDMVLIKEINEDSYWAKEYGVSTEPQKNGADLTAIYDKIIESYLKNGNSGN